MRILLWTNLILALIATEAEARPLVVAVDPGHGGTNLGARSPAGLTEKHVTLFVARVLKTTLERVPGIRVVLTRSRDEYLTLSERVRRANGARADLLLSLHCNASPGGKQRGFEAFVQSPEAVRLEERSTAPAGLAPLGAPPGTALRPEIVAALADLRRAGRRQHAVALGRAVIAALGPVWGEARNRGLQQGRFDVLAGLRMPGVLVELGFLDHPEEGRLLGERDVLVRLAGALARAVLAWAAEIRGFARVTGTGLGDAPPPPNDGDRPKDRRRPAPGSYPRQRAPRPAVAFDGAA